MRCSDCKHWKTAKKFPEGEVPKGVCGILSSEYKHKGPNQGLVETPASKRRARKRARSAQLEVIWTSALLKTLRLYITTNHDFGCNLFAHAYRPKRLPLARQRRTRFEAIVDETSASEPVERLAALPVPRRQPRASA